MAELMKDGLGELAVERIAKAMKHVVPKFKRAQFVKEALDGIQGLELKERVKTLIEVLHQHLPSSFAQSAECLHQIPDIWDFGDAEDPKKGFAAWPVIDYIAVYGLEEPHTALPLLARLTHLFSAEFAIRPFIETHPTLTFSYLEQWLDNDSEHVRRLVSEGTRPRLPWGKQLKHFIVDPSPILPLLNKLGADPSLYVRRSVANNLNDIAKDHPEIVINWCQRFKKNTSFAHTDALIKHACRTLIKNGCTDAFPLLGYSQNPKVTIKNFAIDSTRILMGQDLSFNFIIEAEANSQTIVVDYAIYFLRANQKHNVKVFKLKNITLEKNERIQISKQHSFKAITTRRYYAGEHILAIHINGVEKIRASFFLV